MSRAHFNTVEASEVADWLEANGQRQRAKHVRQLCRSFGWAKGYATALQVEKQRVRAKLTPIAQARATERRAAVMAELTTTADALDRLAKVADTGGEGPVAVMVSDADYLVDLLRRAAAL